MKVSEAKEKFCPFMSTTILNNGKPDLIVHNCICGDCMAWIDITKRWDTSGKPYSDIEGYCARIGQ